MRTLADADDLLAKLARDLSSICPSDGSPRDEIYSYIAIAGKEGLRWILPLRSAQIVNALQQWRPYTWKARVFWQGIILFARREMLHKLPGTRLTSVDLSAVKWASLGWRSPLPPLLVIYVGTTGPHSKLVVTLLDSQSGEPKMVLKLALAPTANGYLRQEFETLKQILGNQIVRAPCPIMAASDFSFTVQTYLHGQPTRPKMTKAHVDFLVNLVCPNARTHLGEVKTGLLRKRDRMTEAGLLTGERLADINRLLDQDGWSGTVPSVRLHGDFAPWNLKRDPEGTISAVDWENSLINGLPYADMVYFRSRVVNLLGGGCPLPWDQYTKALMHADPGLTFEAASFVRKAVVADSDLNAIKSS